MTSDKNPSVAVVHLLRRCNDVAHFDRFIRSYRRFPDALPHALIILFKGFQGGDDSTVLSYLDGVDFIRIDVPDEGFDIGPYLEVVHSKSYDHYCFLNSFSVIVAEAWLSKLYAALATAERAGVVGATGSWESLDSSTAFPNYHIRTTGFMVAGELLRALETREMREKRDTSLFEAGPHGLTSQVLARGFEPYVVDRWGYAWAKEDWPRSETYRAGEQAGLVIADRRTEAYRSGDPSVRTYLGRLAWTDEDPGPNPLKRNKPSRRLRRWLGLATR